MATDRMSDVTTSSTAATHPITNVQKAALIFLRIALAYLFFTQLFWKLPPTFGCPANFALTTGEVAGGQVRLSRTGGLCDWIGIESVWAKPQRLFFTTNIDNRDGPEVFLNLSFLTSLNGSFIDGVVAPNIRWFGWLIWGAEAFIFASLLLGLFSRLGGLVAVGMSAQLMIGLAGITNPYEWEWGYNQIFVLAVLVFAFAPGRFLGLDALLIPRFKKLEENGNRIGRVLLWVTGR
jgi:hypothetical protein